MPTPPTEQDQAGYHRIADAFLACCDSIAARQGTPFEQWPTEWQHVWRHNLDQCLDYRARAEEAGP